MLGVRLPTLLRSILLHRRFPWASFASDLARHPMGGNMAFSRGLNVNTAGAVSRSSKVFPAHGMMFETWKGASQ